MQVRDVMTRDIVGTRPDASIADAVASMLRLHVSGLPVLDAGSSLVGIISEGDLLRRAELGTETHRARWIEFLLGPGRTAEAFVHTHGRKVGEVMTTPVVTVTEDAPLGEAVDLMVRHKIKRLPVVRDGQVVGIVTRSDLLRSLVAQIPAAAATPASDVEIRDAILVEIDRQTWVAAASITVEVVDGRVRLSGAITDERQGEALRVLAENVPGVKAVEQDLIWIEPMSGTVMLSPDVDPGDDPSRPRD